MQEKCEYVKIFRPSVRFLQKGDREIGKMKEICEHVVQIVREGEGLRDFHFRLNKLGKIIIQ